MAKYFLKYTGNEVEELLTKSKASFVPGDYKLTQSQEQDPKWIKCNGAIYDKEDYPSLAHLSIAGIYSESPNIYKFGEYYVRSFGRTFTYYPSLEDCTNGTNGKSVTVTTDTTYTSMGYAAYSEVNGGLYAIGGYGGVLWTATSIDGPYTSHSMSTTVYADDDVDSICGTKHGIYARIWDDSADKEYAVCITSNTGSFTTIASGSIDDFSATEDREYAIIPMYQSATTYVCKGTTKTSVSLPITGTIVDRTYNMEDGVWYAITYSGSSGSRTNYILRCNKDILGNNVDGGSYTSLYNSGTVSDRWSGTYLIGSVLGYTFVVDSSFHKSIRMIHDKKIVGSLPLASLTFKGCFSENGKIYCGGYRIDFNKFNAPKLTSTDGTYYILS